MSNSGRVRIEVSIQHQPAVSNDLHAMNGDFAFSHEVEHFRKRRRMQSAFFTRAGEPFVTSISFRAVRRADPDAQSKRERGHSNGPAAFQQMTEGELDGQHKE